MEISLPITIIISLISAITGGITSFWVFRLDIEKKITRLEDTKLGMSYMNEITNKLNELLNGINSLKMKTDELQCNVNDLKNIIKDMQIRIEENEKEFIILKKEHEILKKFKHNLGE